MVHHYCVKILYASTVTSYTLFRTPELNFEGYKSDYFSRSLNPAFKLILGAEIELNNACLWAIHAILELFKKAKRVINVGAYCTK